MGEEEREKKSMTLRELSVEYRTQAVVLRGRIQELRLRRTGTTSREEQFNLDDRIRTLLILWREARDLAMLTEHYYDRGYRRNARYTL